MRKIIVFLSLLSLIGVGYAIPISGCTTISQPGNYELTQNIVTTQSPCITITTNQASLDCQAHKVTTTGISIGISGQQNTVKKCMTKGNIGIGLMNAKNNTIMDNALQESTYSIYSIKGENNTYFANALKHFRLLQEKNFSSIQNLIDYAYLDAGNGVSQYDLITKVKLCHNPLVYVQGSIIQSVEIGCD